MEADDSLWDQSEEEEVIFFLFCNVWLQFMFRRQITEPVQCDMSYGNFAYTGRDKVHTKCKKSLSEGVQKEERVREKIKKKKWIFNRHLKVDMLTIHFFERVS